MYQYTQFRILSYEKAVGGLETLCSWLLIIVKLKYGFPYLAPHEILEGA